MTQADKPSTNDELASTEAFMEWLRARHPGETEFHQAVHGVVEHVLELVRETPELARHRVLQRLTEPDRSISFRVVWEDDRGGVRINRGYRVQHSNALGPYKGGMRFAPDVDASVLKFLAFEQTFKNALTGLNLGGGKGGADFDPAGRSDSEIMRFCQAFMTELYRHIGAQTDVPAGDIGVGAREIGFLFGQYKRLANEFTGALTGKPASFGGSRLRLEATGYGAVYFLCAMLADLGRSVEGQRIAISGSGNVATYAAEKAAMSGARVVTLSGRRGYIRRDDGFSAAQIARLRALKADGESLADIAEAVDATWVEGRKPWGEECDIAMPAATQNELDEEDAQQLLEHGCRAIVEGANMPLTDPAASKLSNAGVLIAPGKAANAGGVAVSGFEMSQNRIGVSWSAERLDEELREVMQSIYDRTREAGRTGDSIDYRRGADIAGFTRVSGALLAFGYL